MNYEIAAPAGRVRHRKLSREWVQVVTVTGPNRIIRASQAQKERETYAAQGCAIETYTGERA